MAIFQPGGVNSGYRAPAKTMTIKALQDRQKAMQAASEAAAANAAPITNVWQGVGALTNQLGDSVNMGRAERQESEARAQLAQIMSGIDPEKGASMEQIAAMQQLDPEFANKEYERAMAERAAIANREDTQAFTGGQNDLTRQAEADRQAALFGHQTTLQEDTQTHDVDVAATKVGTDRTAADEAATREEHQARINAALNVVESQRAAAVADNSMTAAEADALNAADRQKLEAEIASTLKGTEHGPIKSGAELGMTGEEATKSFQQDVNTKEWKPIVSGGGTNITTNVGGGEKLDETLDVEEGKVWVGHQKAANLTAGSKADMQLLGEIVKMAPQGPIIGNIATLPVLKNFSNAGQAFNSIVMRVAPTLRAEGSGSTSDIEYAGMLNSLPSLGNYPEANNLIIAMMNAKAQVNMERGAVIDQYRNNKLDKEGARTALAEINGRSIMTPELQSVLDAVGKGETPGATDGGDSTGRPADIPQEEWDEMTPEDKALFK